jgi:hypothetical protein
MKVRIVEYRVDPRQSKPVSMRPGSVSQLSTRDDPLEYYDPSVSEGWVELLAVAEPVKTRSRMFYGVASITDDVDGDLEEDGEDIPGGSFRICFENGDSLDVHNTIIAESEAEISAEELNQPAADR